MTESQLPKENLCLGLYSYNLELAENRLTLAAGGLASSRDWERRTRDYNMMEGNIQNDG